MKFYKFEVQDYMDMCPTQEVRTFDSMKDATRFEVQMNLTYSGGITRLLGEMDSVEAANYIRSLYNREKANPQYDSHDILLNAAQMYKQCYGADVLTAEELIVFP